MAHARQFTRAGTSEANAGTHLDSDLDLLFAWDNAHEADTTAHGATGAAVGTTNSQTLTNKTLSGAVISVALTTVAMKREAVTTTATIASDTVIVGITAIASAYTITIPTASITANAGRIWHFKDEVGTCGNAYNITIATAGAETIDGQATYVMCSNYESVKFYSNGSDIFVIQS